MDKRDTLLIVDDMEINRAILRGLFERDYNLLEAENGEQALMLLEQCHEKIAVITTTGTSARRPRSPISVSTW